MAKPTALLPMRKEVEISASYTGKIAVGRFENESPFFAIKEVWNNVTDTDVILRQKVLNAMCYERFVEADQKATIDKIMQQRKDLRFYEFEGKQLPSVTSILSWDADFHVTPQQLVQYGARGTCIHKQIEIFLTTGEWLEVKNIPEVYAEYVTVIKGDLGLKLDDVDPRGFFLKYPLNVIKTEQTVYNLQDLYAGRTDLIAVMDGKKTLCDFKTSTSVNSEKAFKQLSAYAKCLDGIEQLCIIHLNNSVKQGFSKPIMTDRIEEHYQLFLHDRRAFRQVFGA